VPGLVTGEARRQFDHRLRHRRAELLDQEELPVVRHRHDRDDAG
jgi:hypothetical protein